MKLLIVGAAVAAGYGLYNHFSAPLATVTNTTSLSSASASSLASQAEHGLASLLGTLQTQTGQVAQALDASAAASLPPSVQEKLHPVVSTVQSAAQGKGDGPDAAGNLDYGLGKQ